VEVTARKIWRRAFPMAYVMRKGMEETE
jgi:hypothetical protein